MSAPNCTVSSWITALLVTTLGHCFSSSPPAILSNLSTSHTITQSCRRNKKKSRGQLKPSIDMLCQTHKHPHSLTSHILYHTNCVACKYWAGFHTERGGGGIPSLPRNLEIEYGVLSQVLNNNLVPECIRSNLRGSKFKIFLGVGLRNFPSPATIPSPESWNWVWFCHRY